MEINLESLDDAAYVEQLREEVRGSIGSVQRGFRLEPEGCVRRSIDCDSHSLRQRSAV